MRGSVQKAMLVENIEAKFATDGNMETMKDSFKRLLENDNYEQSQPQKQHRSSMSSDGGSRGKQEAHMSNAMSPPRMEQNRMFQNAFMSAQPSRCKHCGKNVIHTDGVCDVFRGFRVSDAPQANNTWRERDANSNNTVVFDGTAYEDCASGFAIVTNVPDEVIDEIMAR
jgi:hypothetical protein